MDTKYKKFVILLEVNKILIKEYKCCRYILKILNSINHPCFLFTFNYKWIVLANLINSVKYVGVMFATLMFAFSSLVRILTISCKGIILDISMLDSYWSYLSVI